MASPFFVFVEEVFLSEHIGLRLCVLLQSSPGNSFAWRRRTSMSLKITNSDVDGVSVLELDGRIVLGEESNSLRETLKSLVAAGKEKIVLNVANIKYIDSTGLGTLVAAHLNAKTQGASVRLCQLGKKFHEIMQVTKLLTVFDVYDTQAAAVGSFQAAKAIAA
jgi:anti-sigma B factor antagonist